jgi:TetR/AcrR family transcriptional regulator, transcriptional repressor for nem operon
VPRKTSKKPVSRDETKQRTRDALIQAGLELFTEQGLDVPSLDAICDRAGFTRGAFYVHFADREALLVAVMDHVGGAFLASVFASAPELDGPSPKKRGAIRTVADRFVRAVEGGAYPLMPAAGGRPMVRMHQLLDACARSSIVRERYKLLVEASVASLATFAGDDQEAGLLRADVDHVAVAQLLLAAIIGAQTMRELGVQVEAKALTKAMLTLVKEPR